MENQQLLNLSNLKLQVLLSAYFGDGCLKKQQSQASFMSTSKDLIEFKAKYLGSNVTTMTNKGWGNKLLYKTYCTSSDVNKILHNSLKENLSLLTDLGIALWFYDDGSLHQKNLFYNLCTHAFTKEEHEQSLIPFFKSKGLEPVLRTERKKDGRMFYYLSFNKYSGAAFIAELLAKYRIEDLSYKIWSSETIQKWSTLQEEWKSGNCVKTFKKFSRGMI